jgi:hypothetical protein
MSEEDNKLKLVATDKLEDTNDGKLKVVFQPGCFDYVDVKSQEELNALMAEITNMYANLTPEELAAQSRPITDEMIDEMEPEEREVLLRALEESNTDDRKSRLQ